jgi:hypothetical protein
VTVAREHGHIDSAPTRYGRTRSCERSASGAAVVSRDGAVELRPRIRPVRPRVSQRADPESAYPNEFFVLAERDLDIGVAKALRLKAKLAIANNQILAIEARLPAGRVSPNVRNGLGSVWPSKDLPVSRVYQVVDGNRLSPMSVEEATAKSLALHEAAFRPYPELAPRSVSFLPIARACQASCPFCFSEASASAEQKQRRVDWSAIRMWLRLATSRGAERAVVTGGGEPTMLPFMDLTRLVGECSDQVTNVVLITNGISLADLGTSEAIERLLALRRAGLSVLAVSRHHHDERINGTLMNAETQHHGSSAPFDAPSRARVTGSERA